MIALHLMSEIDVERVGEGVAIGESLLQYTLHFIQTSAVLLSMLNTARYMTSRGMSCFEGLSVHNYYSDSCKYIGVNKNTMTYI